jgi:hypothetical protein
MQFAALKVCMYSAGVVTHDRRNGSSVARFFDKIGIPKREK